MSFQLSLSSRSRVAARFIRRVHREIQTAFTQRSNEGLSQQQLATKLEVNRATVNKRLLGQDNLTLRSIADLAWAMDCDIDFTITPKVRHPGSNTFRVKAPTALSAEPLAAASMSSSRISATSNYTVRQLATHEH